MHHSKACFCASSVAMFVGLCIIITAFGAICNVAYDKLKDSAPLTSGQQQQQRPQPQQFQPLPPQSQGNNPSQKSSKPDILDNLNQALLSIDTKDFWMVLMLVMSVGVIITCFGYLCANCAVCCCTTGSRRPGSVQPQDKEWPSDA